MTKEQIYLSALKRIRALGKAGASQAWGIADAAIDEARGVEIERKRDEGRVKTQ